MKKPKQTYITQLVQKYPEMPNGLELNDNRRKQLAELMLEYPKIKMEKNRKTLQENKQKKDTTRARTARKNTVPYEES